MKIALSIKSEFWCTCIRKKVNLESLGVSTQNSGVPYPVFASDLKDYWLDVLPTNDQRRESHILMEYRWEKSMEILANYM